MKHKTMIGIAVVVIGILLLAGCGLESDGVPTLKNSEGTQGEASDDAVAPTPDNEAKMMAFTECLREQGIEVMDPVVDADGNVGKPAFANGDKAKAADAAWEACAHHLEGFTAEQERKDMSQVIDQYVALATCLRGKGYDVEDPTAETLDEWELKDNINFDDPDDVADYEHCSAEAFGQEGASE